MSKKVVSKCFQTRPSALGMSDPFMDLVIKNFCPRRKKGNIAKGTTDPRVEFILPK